MTAAYLLSPECLGEQRDYAVYLTAAVRRWRNAVTPLIVTALTTYQDSWVDRLFESVRELWTQHTTPDWRMGDYFRRASSRQKRWWSNLLSRVTGADIHAIDPLLTEPWLAGELNARLAANVRLIKNLGEQTAVQIETIVRDGVRSGVSTKAIAKQIQVVMDTTEKRAQLIARDQVAKHASALNEIRQKEAGMDSYIWSTARDSRVRPAHAEREGKVFLWSQPPKDGHPGQPVRCRCVARPNFGAKIYGFPVKDKYRAA